MSSSPRSSTGGAAAPSAWPYRSVALRPETRAELDKIMKRLQRQLGRNVTADEIIRDALLRYAVQLEEV